jgi:phenylalanyl-tRNA synthetase beta chain
LNWIKDYVDLDIPLSQLIPKLDMIGWMVEEYEEKDGDAILDVETYANRPDALGHLGIAREIAAAFSLPLKEKAWPLTELSQKTSDSVDVQIWDEELCPRYCGIIVKDVQIGPSPEWLKRRVEAIGLRSINNIVDVTNYVLFETAHPIHAFDLSRLRGGKVIVRRAKKGERLRTLDGKDLELLPESLVIADEEKPVALAGVIGGEQFSVTEQTKDVFIESAYFDPVSIRKTGKATGLQTDASFRFERGADISFPPRAALMAASLLSQFGGKVTKGIIDVYPKPRKNKEIVLRHHRVSGLLGVKVSEEFIEQILARLEFQNRKIQNGVWQVIIPFFRVDVEREADLIEEIARFYGYDKIPSALQPLKVLEPSPKSRDRLSKLRQVLWHQGYDEVVNLSFADPEKEQFFRNSLTAVEIRNPISVRASHLRTTLIPGLLENAARNMNRGAEGVHVFELGKIYFWKDEKAEEQLLLGLLSMGLLGTARWGEKSKETDFYYIKGACEAVMSQLRYEPFSFKAEEHPYFQSGFSLALVYKGEKVGCLGKLRGEIGEAFSLKDVLYAAELDLVGLFEKQPRIFQYAPVPKFPAVSRDLSFLADSGISYQDLREALEKLAIPHLEKFELVDHFSGPSIPQGKVSLTIHFVYRNPQATLLAEDVDKMEKRIIGRLKPAFGLQLRQGGKN